MIAIRIFEITFPIFAVVLIGLGYGLRFKPDMNLPNRMNMSVFVPALLFSVLVDQAGQADLFGPLALGCALLVILPGLITWPLARLINMPPATLCPPMMFCNAGNLGLPLIVLTFGEAALTQAVILFIVCNLFHVTLGNMILGRTQRLGRLLLSPMIIATLLALLIGFAGIRVPDVIMQPVRLLGDICVPLMLFALGVRLLDTDFSEWRIGLAVGLSSPALGVLLALLLIPWLQLSPA
ncbi:MAG: AEC family transporter, partial [Thiotrichales bacterium]|nr:AEC family transporter [Thiotrichales bacterium]